jgi:hypothetical protein
MILFFGMAAMAYALDHSHLSLAVSLFLWIASFPLLTICQAIFDAGKN